MRPFVFKAFGVKQDKSVFRVGTDAVLLGALCEIKKVKNVLEIGCGTGIISLMVAQRVPECILTAIDIDKAAVKIATENFATSPFALRMAVLEMDIQAFSETSACLFDLIVCNPPYFPENSSDKYKIARQYIHLTPEKLVESAARVLSPTGCLSVIIPYDQLAKYRQLGLLHHLFVQRQITILPRQGLAPKRAILELAAHKRVCRIEEFTVEAAPRVYSAEYLAATADFHVFD